MGMKQKILSWEIWGCCSHWTAFGSFSQWLATQGSEETLVRSIEILADNSIIHIMLVLRTCKIHELWGHGEFYLYFKGRPEGQAACDIQDPKSSSQEDMWMWSLSWNGDLEMLGIPGTQDNKTTGNELILPEGKGICSVSGETTWLESEVTSWHHVA